MSESKYFKNDIKPVIGEVLSGPFMGTKFALFGRAQIENYFVYAKVARAAKDSRKSYRNCSFKYATWRDAIPYSDKLTPEILDTLKA